jgi:hypothetical protein
MLADLDLVTEGGTRLVFAESRTPCATDRALRAVEF